MFFFGASVFVYFLLNGGAYMRILRYDLFLSSPFASNDLKNGDILEVQGQNVALAVGSATSSQNTAGSLAAGTRREGVMYISIPKIEVNAPIIIPADKTKVGILASLEEGVGLYPGSAEPGKNGRAIILGHSSRASWYRGSYAYVFSLLPKLNEGDEIFVTANNKKMIFRVFSKSIMTPTETNAFLATGTAAPEITLITCYPIGGASKRNVVRAQLVSTENI